ncbi:MAG: BatA and WFA domain-containing protein [Planctomycetaceae bacterium]
MSFAVPTALFLTALALPIIALYILKVRLRRVPVSTNLFWKQVYDEKPPRSLWQNLRHLLSLAAQLLLLLLLVLALTDPYFSWQALQARRLVIVLDGSASMQATDISPSRFEAARAAAHRVLDGLRFRDEVAIVSAGSRPEVVLGVASHVPTLRRAVDAVHPVDAAASLDAAIELARQLIGNHPHGQILVFSDGCAQRADDTITTSLAPIPASVAVVTESKNDTAEDAEETDLASETSSADTASDQNADDTAATDREQHTVKIVHQTFATAAANVGITQFQARRSLADPIGYEILVSVRNASSIVVKGRLELELDQIPVDIIPLTLQPEEVQTRSIEKTSLEGGLLTATLTELRPADPNSDSASTASSGASTPAVNRLPLDDTAWAIVPPRVVQNVLIVTPGNLFLQKVFEANPLVNITVRNDLPSQWPTDTIVVLHRLIPGTLPEGNLLVVDPETDSNLWTTGTMIANPIITEQDEVSPLMTHLRMDNVLLPDARQLKFTQPIHQLAATVTGETVYGQIPRPGGSCLVLSVNLERSDLAFRTAFPILVTNALSWFAGQPGELQPSVMAGQLTTLDTVNQAEEGATLRMLMAPGGTTSPLLSQQIGPLNEVGVWSVFQGNSGTATADSAGNDSDVVDGILVQQIAVNLANENETDLRPVEPASTGDDVVVAGTWLTRPVWFYLIVLATVSCAVEWFLYQRRFLS